jgi:hypothetical protein
MFLGLLLLTGSWGVTLQGWVILYAFSLLFYGMPAQCLPHSSCFADNM